MAKFHRDYISSTVIFFIFFGLSTHADLISLPSDDNVIEETEVGVIVDMGSWIGKTIHACISMAVSDFYESNNHYKTRIVLHTKDSQGKPFRALSAAMELSQNIGAKAIIGLETSLEDEFIAILSEKVKIPVISFSSSITTSPYIVKIRSDEISQFEGIASIMGSYEWNSFILVYEGTKDEERTAMSHLRESFQEKNIHLTYKSVISSSSSCYQIQKELQKMITLETKIYIVDTSLSLASRLLVHAKKLGMVNEEYAWIITGKAMNSVHSMDADVIESLQGTLGFKPYIPESSKIQNIYYFCGPNIILKEFPIVGLWAYDTIQALAEAFERASKKTSTLNDQVAGSKFLEWTDSFHSYSGMLLLHELSHVRFEGLSGEFQLMDGKLYPEEFILENNVEGNMEKRVGTWKPKERIFERTRDLKGDKISSQRRLLQIMSRKRLRIGVPSNKRGFEELIDVRYDPKTNETTFSGYCIDVFRSAIVSLNYEVPYEFVPFSIDNIMSYSDFVDLVYFKKIDGFVGDVTITANRTKYVDFTLPFTDLGVGTIARLRNEYMWTFLKPLDAKLWLVSGSFFFLTGFLVWAIERSNNNNQFREGSVTFQIGTIFWFGFSTLVYAHREKLTRNLSRIVVLVWVFVVLILTSSYTATLSSLLTVKQIQIGSAGEFLGTQRGSFVGVLVADNLNFEDWRLKGYISPEEYAQALSRGHKDGGVDAIIDEIPYVKVVLSRYSSDLALVSYASTTGGFGFVFPKGSPLVRDISKAIVSLRENGRLEKMERSWFSSKSSFLPDSADAKSNIINFEQFRGLFLVSGTCLATVTAIYLTELLLEKFQVSNIFISLLKRGFLVSLLRHFPLRKAQIEMH